MSDFIYSSNRKHSGYLTSKLKSIKKTNMFIKEYHGDWGSIAFIENHYKGYKHYNTERFLILVIGGPLLEFELKNSINEDEYSENILQLWIEKGESVEWDKALNGPFAIFILDKRKMSINIITDLMSHIPVYNALNNNEYTIGSHPDIVSKVSNNSKLDQVSVVDLFLNKSITYPYTIYENVYQLSPSTIKIFNLIDIKEFDYQYWVPLESEFNKSYQETINELNHSISSSVEKITREKNKIGMLMSGGEDSRMILANLHNLKKIVSCFTFIDSDNIESRIAKKVTKKFNYKHDILIRDNTYYLDFLEECTRVVGTQNNSEHVHSYKFAKVCNLDNYDAILGGLFSDVYFKGNRITNVKEKKFLKVKYAKTVLTVEDNLKGNAFNKYVDQKLLTVVLKRRKQFIDKLKSFRPTSYSEWTMIWPSTMNYNFTNYQGNRRLFSSYEPMLDNNVVKIMSGIPQQLKLDSMLYKDSIKDFLKPTWQIPHSEGHYPYFGIKLNYIPTLLNKVYKKAYEKTTDRSMGSWPNWNKVINTERMDHMVNECEGYFNEKLSNIFNSNKLKHLISADEISPSQKLILLQIVYGISYWSKNN